ncbi:MAG: alpha/beta hydrolase, partial [Candidatus Dormibacteria bacterium]
KIRNVMLAAPDVDIDIAREQITAMGADKPQFTLFVSEDDHALALSRKVWGEPRLGSINPDQEPYKSTLAREQIHVINLTGVSSADQLHHDTFAANPRVVELIGRSIASGQTLTDSRVGFGEKVFQTTTGATATIGQAAGLVVAAPVAIVDPLTREQLGDQVDAFSRSVQDAATPQ